jgi:hypothetical protein
MVYLLETGAVGRSDEPERDGDGRAGKASTHSWKSASQCGAGSEVPVWPNCYHPYAERRQCMGAKTCPAKI